MGKFYEEIPEFMIPWIQKQKLFWVATAPLTGTGHVNVSPKGNFGTSFNVVDNKKVWYEDLTGSGNETIAHLREKGNGRITILFQAFEGPPRICRLFGTGTVYEFGTPEYEALLPGDKRQVGSRAVIMIDVYKVGTSCGFAIPIFEFKCDRNKLHTIAATKEGEDVKKAKGEDYKEEQGLKWYWESHNAESLDGLPALECAYKSSKAFNGVDPRSFKKDDERLLSDSKATRGSWFNINIPTQGIAGFVIGVVTVVLLQRQQRV